MTAFAFEIEKKRMLVSELLSRLNGSMEWSEGRSGNADIVVAMGSIRGTWKAFGSLERGMEQNEAVALISPAAAAYGQSGMSTAKLKEMLETFIRDYGDMDVAVQDADGIHSRIDMNVEEETDRDGNEIGWVAIIQAYVAKPSMSR